MHQIFRRVVCAGALLFPFILGFGNAVPARAAETDWFTIESIPPEDVLPPQAIEKLNKHSTNIDKELRARIKANNRILIKITTPSGPGPFPVVVSLHGCGGPTQAHYEDTGNWFRGLGYAFVIVESHKLRGIGETCMGKVPFILAVRAGDAYAALAYLAKNREKYRIDPGRALLIGFSAGAQTITYAMRTGAIRWLERKRKDARPYAGAMALYPGCHGKRPTFYNPVTIIIGALDDWTPAEDCEKWAKSPPPKGSARLDVHVLADATHGFDNIGNGFTGSDFEGHQVEYNPRAVEKAHKIMQAFLHGIEAAVAQKLAAGNSMRRALAGNTLRMTNRRGRTQFLYFSPDGREQLSVVGGRQFLNLRWHVDDSGRLCLSRPRSGGERCARADLKGDAVVFHGRHGTDRKVALLPGKQLPKGGGRAGEVKRKHRQHAKRPSQATGKPSLPPVGGGYLDEAALRHAVIGNTVAFRAPRKGYALRVYFAPDGHVELKTAERPAPVTGLRWSFKPGGELCRTIKRGGEHCIRAKGDPQSGALTFVSPKFIYRVTVIRGKHLSGHRPIPAAPDGAHQAGRR